MKDLTIREVARQLLDGFDNHNFGFVCERLELIRKRYDLTVNQLNELCWLDSNAVFNMIY